MKTTLKRVSYKSYYSKKVEFCIKMSFKDIRESLRLTSCRDLKVVTVSEEWAKREHIAFAFAIRDIEAGNVVERFTSYNEAVKEFNTYTEEEKEFFEVMDFFGMMI